MQVHQRKEFYFHHRRSLIGGPPESETQAVNPNKTDTATNGFPFATTRCDKLNSSKVTIQIPKHFATPKSCTFASIVCLNPPCPPIQKRKQPQHNQFNYFFNAKAYAKTQHQHNCARINSFTASRIVEATHTLVHLAPAA